MRFIARYAGILLVLLALIPFSVTAQEDNTTITMVGSGIAQPLFQALAEASESGAELNSSVTGTGTGFTQFCAGEADVTTANRRITVEENTNCINANQNYFELLIGVDIVAFVANPAADFVQCLTRDQLNQIFAPSAQEQTTNWNQIIPDAPDTPLTVLIPDESTSTHAILDRVVEGDGIRSDATIEATSDGLTAVLSADTGAIGVLRLSEANTDSIKILELNAGEIDACQAPTAENVEDNLYQAADQLYIYVNTSSLSKTGLTELLTFMTEDTSASIVQEQGFFSPTADTYQKNRDTLQAAITGEPIIPVASEFTAPVGVAGTVNVGGSANGFTFMKSASDTFTATNPDITITSKLEGEPAGFRRLCNGEIDITIAYRPLSEEEAGNCEANNITTISLDLGKRAVVLLANATSEYLNCLTTEQIATTWRADSANTITTWDQVNQDFDNTAMTLFAPTNGSPDTDLLLIAASGSELINRVDTQEDNDPLYRAAATANVEGALTYLSWADYQRVLENNQANIQLVAVDAGSGCIAPDLETIADASYPLSRSGQLIINKASLAKPEVQAFVWYLASNENYPSLEANGFIGVRFGDLVSTREALQHAFSEAEAEALLIAAEATPEATVEATAEATAEATESN